MIETISYLLFLLFCWISHDAWHMEITLVPYLKLNCNFYIVLLANLPAS
jgi:hypothetical protein